MANFSHNEVHDGLVDFDFVDLLNRQGEEATLNLERFKRISAAIASKLGVETGRIKFDVSRVLVGHGVGQIAVRERPEIWMASGFCAECRERVAFSSNQIPLLESGCPLKMVCSDCVTSYRERLKWLLQKQMKAALEAKETP